MAHINFLRHFKSGDLNKEYQWSFPDRQIRDVRDQRGIENNFDKLQRQRKTNYPKDGVCFKERYQELITDIPDSASKLYFVF